MFRFRFVRVILAHSTDSPNRDLHDFKEISTWRTAMNWMLHEFGNRNDAMLDKIKIEKGIDSRLKAFYPCCGAAIVGTLMTSWQATTLCLYVHAGKGSMDYGA